VNADRITSPCGVLKLQKWREYMSMPFAVNVMASPPREPRERPRGLVQVTVVVPHELVSPSAYTRTAPSSWTGA